MCKRCKHCGKSDLGVLITQISTVAARKVDGKIVEFFKDSEENSQKEEVNYCFTCNKSITEDDLIETVVCKSCGKEVDHVDENGLCDECAKVKAEAEEEARKLASMTQEEIVAMLIAQKMGKPVEPVQHVEPEKEEVKEPVKEEITTSETVTEIVDDVEINKQEEKEDAPAKQKTVKKRAPKKKEDPAPVNENEVADAEKENEMKVDGADLPESVQAQNVGIIDEKGTEPIDVDTTIPVPGNGEEEDILAALDKVQLGENGIPDIF